ncbi:putative O-linked N-acetylglucosamine transferase (SPINDLY family) [Azospirillum lipoferum]|nr:MULTISPECIES: tetratricopeptide repeat protein [Azospirillum]MCP1613563.1 putative O-linked N-acetylglucosamine transferase (SPINDLY family) [Azospirillum lipoferum]MDW5532326.1 tetratricopeptide repeat protein [Azospirillum sp. NL1]
MKPNHRPTHRPAGTADAQALLTRAVTHHQNGQLAEAATLYEQVLKRLPKQADALHLSGLIKAQTGALADGIERIRQAVKADPKQPLFHANLGRLMEAAERWPEAATAFQAAARLAPLDPSLPRLLAAVLTRAGQQGPAAQALQRAMALEPADAESAGSLGDALYDGGRFLPAADWYGRASRLEPQRVLAAFNRGAALRDAGRMEAAAAAFRALAELAPQMVEPLEQYMQLGGGRGAACRLLMLVPGHPAALRTLGSLESGTTQDPVWLARLVRLEPLAEELVLALAGRLYGRRTALAERAYRHALALAPASGLALSGLGLARATLGVEGATRWSLRALRVAPGDAALAGNAGSAFQLALQPEAALSWHRRALALMPGDAAAWVNIGTLRLDANAAEEAIPPLERARRLGDPGQMALASSNLGVAWMALGLHGQAVAAFRTALDRAPEDAAIRSNMLFCLCFDDRADPVEVFREHRAFERHLPAVPAAPHTVESRDPERRLRVGYLSPDFQRYPGPGYHFLLPLIEGHDRGAVEVTCYHNDRSRDATTDRFQAAADRWRDVAALSDEDLDRRIREDRIDILVDAGGHMSRNRMPLMARRPAPVQVSLPLYPNTTGLGAVDYQIADPRLAPPGADALHVEKLIRLPGCVLCYRPADSAFMPASLPPVERNGHITFGSFNNITKVNAATIALWARLLAAVPTAKLVLKWRGLGSGGGADRRLLAAFARHGIGAERLELRGITPDPYQDYVTIDVALDPVFANGGTTICDALWMGVPVLNQTGPTKIGHWGATLLPAVGMAELVTGDDDAYLAQGIRLATDRAFLDAQRNGLRERMRRSALMDEAAYARAVEAGYRTAWRRRCAGLPPVAFDVAEGEGRA